MTVYLTDAYIIFQREVCLSNSCTVGVSKTINVILDSLVEGPQYRIIVKCTGHQHNHDVSYTVECELSRMASVMTAIALDNNIRHMLWN